MNKEIKKRNPAQVHAKVLRVTIGKVIKELDHMDHCVTENKSIDVNLNAIKNNMVDMYEEAREYQSNINKDINKYLSDEINKFAEKFNLSTHDVMDRVQDTYESGLID